MSPRSVVGAFAHLARWVDYHSAGHVKPSPCSARLTFYSSDAPAVLPAAGHTKAPGSQPGAFVAR
jgi:hypothetical protein